VSRRDASEAIAHLPHPGGSTGLCGRPPTRLKPCKACLARRASLGRVHVQSPRKTSEAFCGISLGRGGGDPSRDIAPMYVRPDQARELLSSGSGLEFCPGCRGNLERHDVAARQRMQRIVGEPAAAPDGLVSESPVSGRSRPAGRRRPARGDPPGLTEIPAEDP